MSRPLELPRWIEWGLLPLVNLALALGVCSAVLAVVGLPPQQVFTMLFKGAFGSAAGWSYTLFYATTFVFTGLAVAVAFHGGSFNVGGEGQAMIGGLGCALVALSVGEHLGQQLPTDLAAIVVLPMMIVAAMLGGAVWAAVPAVLLAWRGSHLVITTIMFNFIASSLMAGLLVGPLKAPGSMMVETVAFPISARMPGMHEILQRFGVDWPRTPLNLTLLLAMAAAIAVGLYLTRSRWGYELRTVGFSSDAARYGGIQPGQHRVISLLIAGALAGLVGINELAGAQPLSLLVDQMIFR